MLNGLRGLHQAVIRKLGVSQFEFESWRARCTSVNKSAFNSLNFRKLIYLLYRLIITVCLLPILVPRYLISLCALLYDYERVHFRAKRKIVRGYGCLIDKNTHLINGENIILGDFVKISCFTSVIAGANSRISIGSNSIIASGVMICSTNHGIKPVGIPIRYQSSDDCDISIGSNVWIGANAVILPGAKIANGAVIAAGTLVNGTVPENSIFYQKMTDSRIKKR